MIACTMDQIDCLEDIKSQWSAERYINYKQIHKYSAYFVFVARKNITPLWIPASPMVLFI